MSSQGYWPLLRSRLARVSSAILVRSLGRGEVLGGQSVNQRARRNARVRVSRDAKRRVRCCAASAVSLALRLSPLSFCLSHCVRLHSPSSLSLSLFLFLSLFLSPALSLWNRRRLIHWNSVSPLSSLFYMCLNHPQSVACYSTELKRPPASCSGTEERGFSWHLTRRRQLSRLDAFPFGERDGTISALLLSNPNGQSS